jgi:hypothetical protein
MAKQKTKFKKKLSKIVGSRIIYTSFSLLVIIVASYFAIQYARGNWRVTEEGVIANTGLLNANSFPQGAQVFINDNLTTATDDTIYLQPGTYNVKVIKEGYSLWEKELEIQKELVTQTNATLFPIAPSITPLTFTGIKNVYPSPDGQKLLFFVDGASLDARNGLYLLALSNNFLSLQSGPKQLSDNPLSYDLENADIIWSPDSTEIMLMTVQGDYLLTTDKKVSLVEENNISLTKNEILSQWEEDIYLRERQYLARFPEEMIAIATQSAKNVYISPDKKRMLYTATASATIPEGIVPPVPATNTQEESRNLEIGGIYVYDREEDKNFKIAQVEQLPDILGEKVDSLNLDENAAESKLDAESIVAQAKIDQKNQEEAIELLSLTGLNLDKVLLSDDLDAEKARSLEASPTAFSRLQKEDNFATAYSFSNYYTAVKLNSIQWFPDSKHVLLVEDDRIQIMEYDSQNNTTVYSGPFADNFIYPWPDGSKLIITTAFSPDSPVNLYAINLE